MRRRDSAQRGGAQAALRLRGGQAVQAPGHERGPEAGLRLRSVFIYCCATSPAARSTPRRSARAKRSWNLAVHGLHQPAHVVQAPLPLLRLPALLKQNHRIRGSLQGSMGVMLLYRCACGCGQPVRSGLPLQHAQGALLLSYGWGASGSVGASAGGGASTGVVSPGGGFDLLWSSRLSRHVLLRFVLAPRGRARLLRLLRLRLVFSRLHLIIRGQDITRTTKSTREAGRCCRQAEAHAP